ncbi:MAG: site-2 protease family protein [Clostridiales bacterium]|nr:site-2 protease family protein [Clostridiales bacterium]
MIYAMLYGGGALDWLINIVFVFLAACVGIVCHEVAHGLVAKWNGDNTAKNAGRLTLNPLKHFDLIGFIMMMCVGFGYAKPVPVNPYNFKHFRRGLFLVAIAGIVTNVIIAFFSALLYGLMVMASVKYAAFGYFAYFFSILLSINLSLAFFNLLPIFPLDGFRIVEVFTHRGNKFCDFMRTNGQYLILILVGLGFLVSMAFNYAALPSWFRYIDVLGTYINFFVGHVGNGFVSFWGLMLPGV